MLIAAANDTKLGGISSTLEHGLKLQNKLDALEKWLGKRNRLRFIGNKGKSYCLCKKAGAAEHKCKQPSSYSCKNGKLQAGMSRGNGVCRDTEQCLGLLGGTVLAAHGVAKGLRNCSNKITRKTKNKTAKGLKLFSLEKRFRSFS